MSFRRYFRLPLVCLLIIGLLAGSASASNYVWCVSADGDHTSLEFAPTGDCSQNDCLPATGDFAIPGFEAGTNGCGPCLDISSSHQGNVSRSRQGGVSVETPAALPSVVPDAFSFRPERIFPPYRGSDLPPRIPDPILHHRTIVLLI